VTPAEWIRAHVEPTGPIELAAEEPWSTVLRVPVDGDILWFKHCKSVCRSSRILRQRSRSVGPTA